MDVSHQAKQKDWDKVALTNRWELYTLLCLVQGQVRYAPRWDQKLNQDGIVTIVEKNISWWGVATPNG